MIFHLLIPSCFVGFQLLLFYFLIAQVLGLIWVSFESWTNVVK